MNKYLFFGSLIFILGLIGLTSLFFVNKNSTSLSTTDSHKDLVNEELPQITKNDVIDTELSTNISQSEKLEVLETKTEAATDDTANTATNIVSETKNSTTENDLKDKLSRCEATQYGLYLPKIDDLLVRLFGATKIFRYMRVVGITDSKCIVMTGYKMTTSGELMSGEVECKIPTELLVAYKQPNIDIDIAGNDLIDKRMLLDIGQKIVDDELDVHGITLSESELQQLNALKNYAESSTPRPYLMTEEDGINCYAN